MESLHVRVNKSVEVHVERLNAIERALRWVPQSANRLSGIPDPEPKLTDALLAGKYRIPEARNSVIDQHIMVSDRHVADYIQRDTDGWQGRMTHAVVMSSFLEEVMLKAEPTTFVGSDIVELIEIAASSASPEALHYTDLPSPRGFMYFERPIISTIKPDEYSEEGVPVNIGIRAIGWNDTNTVVDIDGTGSGGILLYIYTDFGCIRYITNEEIDTAYPDNVLALIDCQGWAYGQKWREGREGETTTIMTIGEKVDDEVIATSDVIFTRKFITTIFRFMWQELLVAEPSVGLTRAFKRNAKRITGHDDPLCILKLRRHSTGGSGDGEGSRLDYRTIVRGHWRNQWYPSLGASGDPDSHRLIWIDPHVRGPEDAPWSRKKKATALVR
jgi:hypothetical protein